MEKSVTFSLIKKQRKLFFISFEIIIVSCFCALILIYLGITTVILILSIILSLIGLIYLKYIEVKEKGLINFLPDSFKKLMTQRSIFDILMDIWFLPTITEYVKMLIKPIIYKLSPEEATKVLEDFNPSVRKVFLTKGVVHLLPNSMKSLMLPNNQEKLEEEENFSGSTRENELFEIKSDSSLKNNSEKCNCNIMLEEEKCPIEEERKISFINKDNKVTRTSSDKVLIKEDKEFIKEEKKEQKPVSLVRKSKENYNKIKEFDYVEIEDPDKGMMKYKTRVIESTDKLNSGRKRSNRVSFDKIHNILKKSNIPLNNFCFEDLDEFNCNCDLKQYNWDNLDTYYHKIAKNALKEEKNLSPKVKKHINKVSFGNVLSELIKNHVHLKVNFEKIGKYSLILLSTLLIQAIINRKITHLSFSVLNFISFLCTSFGISTILYLGFFKGKKKMLEGEQVRDKENKESSLMLNGIKARLKN